MPLSIFHNQNKKAKLVIVSHNALLGGYGGFSFGFEEGVKAQNTPLFSYKFKQT